MATKLKLNTKFYVDSEAVESGGNICYAFPSLDKLVKATLEDGSDQSDFAYELTVTRTFKRVDPSYVEDTQKEAKPKTKKKAK